ncbi:unnamed protein product [Lactuca virosa]|uniref:Uncharacterized protein n=1 Tax=Lactuca virosa TaxID=75947 RepID=A0AAU9PRU1_9ASTR|nr:unnamed protein product [Lactuca virosa]
MVAPSLGSSSLKKYLKRYENNEEEEKKKKKKKKKMKTKPDMNGVLVVDEDPVWQKPVRLEEEDDESQDEEKPQVDEYIEVKRMKRLEKIKRRRPFGAISEDGSGWVPVSDTAKNSDISSPRRRRPQNDTPEPESESQHITELNSDMSPPRKRRARNDTPEPEPEPEPNMIFLLLGRAAVEILIFLLLDGGIIVHMKIFLPREKNILTRENLSRNRRGQKLV